MSLLALAPLVVLVLLVDSLRAAVPHRTLREHVLGAAVLLGVAVALATELMGVFRVVTFAGVIGFWLTAVVAAAAFRVWCGQQFAKPAPLRLPALGALERALVAAVLALGALLFVVAWLSPPQSSDSIGYHMARVMHWIQNGSLAHYPTADPPQLFEPPFAEMLRLHLQLLSGGDRAGCLVQWFFAMGSLAGASLVARDLGGGRRAQILAAVVAVTLPIGITQASSGKNGWVEAFWLLSLVHFGSTLTAAASTSEPRTSRATAGRLLTAFAALGLELATKISAWLFAPPFVLLAAWHFVRGAQADWRRLRLPVVAGSLIVAAVASPYLVRNLSLYGHPLVDTVFLEKSGLELVSPAAVASNVFRNVVFQLGTGNAAIDRMLRRATTGFHGWIELDASDPRTTQFGPFEIEAPKLVEEVAFSPLHILLVFVAALALLASPRLRAGGMRLPYLVALLSAFVLYSSAVQWQPPSCRLLMPLLVLAAPLVAVVLTDLLHAGAVAATAAVLFAASAPYAVAVESRPLSLEADRGILATPRQDLYFARVPDLRDSYRNIAHEVRARNTQHLGVQFLDDGEPEYLLWMLLEGAEPPVRIRNVRVGDASRSLGSAPPRVPPELVALFASDSEARRFDDSISVEGIEYRRVKRFEWAALYAPVKRPGGP